jgi:hypothetical protein
MPCPARRAGPVELSAPQRIAAVLDNFEQLSIGRRVRLIADIGSKRPK